MYLTIKKYRPLDGSTKGVRGQIRARPKVVHRICCAQDLGGVIDQSQPWSGAVAAACAFSNWLLS